MNELEKLKAEVKQQKEIIRQLKALVKSQEAIEDENMDTFDKLLGMDLNSELQFPHGRYIRVPGGWVLETIRDCSCCFIPHTTTVTGG